jgi:hypothetical protein
LRSARRDKPANVLAGARRNDRYEGSVMLENGSLVVAGQALIRFAK